MLMMIGMSAQAHGGKKCGKCYQAHPYILADKVESRCITEISVCSVKQSGASFFYQFKYGYKENRVMIFSNGKQSRYTARGTENTGTFVDLVELKTENADVANGDSKNKVRDEKSYALAACKSEQEVWRKTYDFCN